MAQKRKGRVIAAAVLAILAVAAAESWAVTICDVQKYDDMGLSPLAGQTVTVQGVITLLPGYFQPDYSSFYMEWEDCGVNLFSFDPVPVQLALGDTVEVTGQVTEYQSSGTGAGSTTEIEFTSIAVIGEATSEPEPTYLSLQELGQEENEGRLLRTIGVVREENLPYDIYIWQPWSGADVQVYRANTELDLGGFAVGDTIEVTGILMQYDRTPPFFDGWELSPRFQSDMKLAVPPPPPDPEFWANAALRVPSRVFRPDLGEVIPIAYLAPDESEAKVEIYDLQGRRVRKLADGEYVGYSQIPEFHKNDFFVEGTNGWDGRNDLRAIVPAGTYICRLEVAGADGRESVVTAPIIVGIKLGE